MHTQSTMPLTLNIGLAIDTILGVHTLTEGFSEMKVRSACLTSVLSLVVLKSFRAFPAVVCEEDRGKEDELEGGGGSVGGGGVLGYPPRLSRHTYTHPLTTHIYTHIHTQDALEMPVNTYNSQLTVRALILAPRSLSLPPSLPL